jgi:hypothetical protein
MPVNGLLKPLAKWYIGNFYVNRKEDNEMYLISSRAIDNAEPRRLKKTILSIASYTVWDKLEFIDSPTLIVATSLDGLHVHDDVTRMASTIKGAKYIDLENNKRTHSPELAFVIRDYLDGLRS